MAADPACTVRQGGEARPGLWWRYEPISKRPPGIWWSHSDRYPVLARTEDAKSPDGWRYRVDGVEYASRDEARPALHAWVKAHRPALEAAPGKDAEGSNG